MGLFFMRVEWAAEDFDFEAFRCEWETTAASLDMKWHLRLSHPGLRVAVFVSQHLHCLADVLYRHRAGEFPCAIPLIVSNHRDAEALAAFHSLPFVHIPVSGSCRQEAEEKQIRLLEEEDIDLIVLARYMQILSPHFVAKYPSRIINVHHSFLPAFTGARPYHAAFHRGVKLIGATSHYVTDELDEGPIIDQDVIRISHRDQVPDLIRKGRDVERSVLSRAILWHLQHRILTYGNKTVVFD